MPRMLVDLPNEVLAIIMSFVWIDRLSTSRRRRPCIPDEARHSLFVCKRFFYSARLFLPPTCLYIDSDAQYVRAARHIVDFHTLLLKDCQVPQFRNITYLVFTCDITCDDDSIRDALTIMRIEKLSIAQHDFLSVLGTPPAPLPFLQCFYLHYHVRIVFYIGVCSTTLNVSLQYRQRRGDASPVEAQLVTLPDDWLSSLTRSAELRDVSLEVYSAALFDVECVEPRSFSYPYCVSQLLPIIRLWTVDFPSILHFTIGGEFAPGSISFNRHPGQLWEDFEFSEDDPLGSVSGRSGWEELNLWNEPVNYGVDVEMWESDGRATII